MWIQAARVKIPAPGGGGGGGRPAEVAGSAGTSRMPCRTRPCRCCRRPRGGATSAEPRRERVPAAPGDRAEPPWLGGAGRKDVVEISALLGVVGWRGLAAGRWTTAIVLADAQHAVLAGWLVEVEPGCRHRHARLWRQRRQAGQLPRRRVADEEGRVAQRQQQEAVARVDGAQRLVQTQEARYPQALLLSRGSTPARMFLMSSGRSL
jgi:hypothetical protein